MCYLIVAVALGCSTSFLEINNVSAQEGHVLQPRHDFLEVSSYICHGLAGSPIDRWFSGDIPTGLSPARSADENDLDEIMRVAYGALSDPNETRLDRVGVRH